MPNKKNAYAQNNLGYMYYHGQGVEKDYKEAIKWYKLSAEQGFSSAQNNLGQMYQKGLGVEKDYEEAIILFKLSGEKGNHDAIYNLQELYKKNYDKIAELIINNKKIIQEQKERIKKLEEENERLTYMAPLEGGPEYQKIKKNFEEKVKNNYGSLDIENHN